MSSRLCKLTKYETAQKFSKIISAAKRSGAPKKVENKPYVALLYCHLINQSKASNTSEKAIRDETIYQPVTALKKSEKRARSGKPECPYVKIWIGWAWKAWRTEAKHILSNIGLVSGEYFNLGRDHLPSNSEIVGSRRLVSCLTSLTRSVDSLIYCVNHLTADER